MNTLSSLDLEQLVKQYGINNFNGIYSKDLVPSNLVQGWYIINLESHDKGNGTHWTCFKITNDKLNIYFDSFNFIAPIMVSELIAPYVYNDKQIQDTMSSACGFYCIACMNYIEKHNAVGDYLAFKDFVNAFSKNQDYNDNILQRYL